MQDYYADLWERLPDQLVLPDWGLRLSFARREVGTGNRVLDLGFGSGEFTRALAAAGARVVGAEVAAPAVQRAQARHPSLEFVLVPIDGPLPFADGSFDVVWSSEVIEHVADTARWMSEVRRVLAPGGRLLVTTPSHGRLRVALLGMEHFSPPLGDHLHLYTRRSLTQVLGEFGFDEISVRAVGGLPLLRRMLIGRGVR